MKSFLSRPIFTGSGVALVTPFSKENEVDYAKLRELLEFHYANRTDAIIVTGTTGENATLENWEHLNIIEEAVEYMQGKLPVIAGTGSNDTRHAIHMSKEAEFFGVDGLLLVTPYYNKTSQEGLITHYKAIAESVPTTPIILYNVPGRTGMTILPETYLELSKIPNIVATKEACGNLDQIKKTMELCGDTLDIYSGNDEDIANIVNLGGIGVISVLANIFPYGTHLLADPNGMNNEIRKTMQEYYNPVIKALFSDVSPMPIKEAMNIMGMDVGECRLPLIRMNEEKQNELKLILNKYRKEY